MNIHFPCEHSLTRWNICSPFSSATGIRHLLVLSAFVAMIWSPVAVSSEVLRAVPISPDVEELRAGKSPASGLLAVPTEPMIPDPMISTLPPGAEYRDRYWKQMREMRAREAAKSQSAGPVAQSSISQRSGQASLGGSSVIILDEGEIGQGGNDTQAEAVRITRFGTGDGSINRAIISGSFGDAPLNRPLVQAEDDGAIGLALDSMVDGSPESVSFFGEIGDHPGAGVYSDFDFVLATLPGGTVFDVSVRTSDPFGDLDPFVTFYLPDGEIIFLQDDGGNGFDTFVRLTTNEDITFLMSIGGFGAFFPVDPFDPTSGSITGAIGSEGIYQFEMRIYPPPQDLDVDFFSFYLKKGDVFGAAVRNSAVPDMLIFNAEEAFEKGVAGFGSFAEPDSPLPVNGSTVIDYIAERTGMYAIAIGTAFERYELELGVYRPGFERDPRRVQLIWLDYNGGPVDKQPWFGIPFITDHTPLRGFLPAWGLPDRDHDVRRITRKITAETRDNLKREVRRSRENRNFGVVVLGNDGTGRWDWIEPFIERGSFTFLGITFEISVVEVSGTIEESLIQTIGIASTIDPGNYSPNDQALLLLDVLSAPPSGISADFSFSLNDVELAPGATKEQLVVTVLANIIAHEVGHYIGNFHTDGFTPIQNLMDEGPGGLFNLAGIGPSGVFGAFDQTDVGFFDDLYSVAEGFFGNENTTVNTAFALSFFPFGLWH